ncbi:MAG: crossover junction endodeoxyribonuclease RuvC [candidate division WOR-3 bacterium]
MKILGIDPGLSATGFAVLSTRTNSPKSITYGTIRSDKKKSLGERIEFVIKELRKVIRREKIKSCACETLFFKKEASKSVILSCHLRGAILYLLAQEKIPLYEVNPLRLKLAITGQGRASKRQVNYMIKNLLNITDNVGEDEADALACAYYLKEKLKEKR